MTHRALAGHGNDGLKVFHYMLTAKASSFKHIRQRALLLHCAGEKVQEIFKTLADTGSAAKYEKAVNALNMYFIPKVKFDIPKSCLPEYGTA